MFWGSKNGLNNGADRRVQGQGHVQPCPLLTRFASSVNTAAQSYAAGFESQHDGLGNVGGPQTEVAKRHRGVRVGYCPRGRASWLLS